MWNIETTQPVGFIDSTARTESARQGHGDVVVEALSPKVRFLIAGVLLTNLALGAWLVGRSDFSGLKPQGEAEAAQVAAPGLKFVAVNDRD